MTTRADIRPDNIRRFWAKVQKGPGCWLWTASKRAKGYGAFCWVGTDGVMRQDRAHRFSYLLYFGRLAKAICVLHDCDNPACVKPSHLHLGSKADNNAEMCKRGRHRKGGSKTPVPLCKYPRGEKHPMHKLTAKDVRKMRSAWRAGQPMSRIARRFGVTSAAAKNACTGRTWTNVC